jgi:hypothetical protein
MSMLSHGPFNYNRFSVLDEKKAKPDFLDMDKDGNKKESMKKASKDKECDDCGKKDCGCDDKKKSGKKELPDFIKKNMKKEEVIELEFDDAANWLIENGICKDETGCEVWLEHAAPETLDALADKIQENRAMANGGHPLVGDGSKPKAPQNPKNKTQTMMGKDGKPLFKENTIVKEDVLEYMIETNMVNNSVSAEALFNHITDEFLEEIEKNIMEIYVGKHGQTEKQHQDSRSDAGKMISGDSKSSGSSYSSRGTSSTGPNPAGGSTKPAGQGRMTTGARNELVHRKGEFMKKHGYKATGN